MLARIRFDTVTRVSKIQVRGKAEMGREELERQHRLARALQAQHAEAISPIQAAPGLGDSGGGGDPPNSGGNVMEIDPRSSAPPAAPFVRPMPKGGRNEPCPCGSGRKDKH